MEIDFEALKAEFPREAVSWRAQKLKGDGSAALALAYIDARDVMDRLDEVCGPANWQDNYPVVGVKTLCSIGIKIDGEWVYKTDGAGDTQVEAEKGSLSDALKRAAVKWGIGRYLYALPAIWVECESDKKNGKYYFKKWKVDPWSKVKPSNEKPVSSAHQKRKLKEIDDDLVDCHTDIDVNKCAAIWKTIAINEGWSKDYQIEAANRFQDKREELQDDNPFPEAAE